MTALSPPLSTRAPRRRLLRAGCIAIGLPLLWLALSPGAMAHHLVDLLNLEATPLHGLLSGLAHPLLGPDHLLFLLALSLIGLRHRGVWMLALLGTGLLGSLAGLLTPSLPAAEALVALTLVAVALVLMGRLPRGVLVPAMALHGYVLSGAVLGWSGMPVTTYLIGLLLSQGLLLGLSLVLLQRLSSRLSATNLRWLAGVLVGVGGAWAWSQLVA